MDLCYPTIATAALFAAIFITDIRNNQYNKIFLHFLFSIICILLITYLCNNGYNFISWTLLLFPFVLIFIATSLQPVVQVLPSIPVTHPTRKCAPGCPKPSCGCSSKKAEPVSKESISEEPVSEEPKPAPSSTCGPNGNSPRCIEVDSLPSV